MWPGVGEEAKRLGVARLNGGEVLGMTSGESTYFLQPREREVGR
jgi:hypothetical protein